MLEGQAEMIARLQRQRTSVPDAVRGATGKVLAPELLQESQDLCPVLTGGLKGSGHIEATPEGFDVVYSAPYALDVHESLARVHPAGQAKFLEQPYLAQRDQVPEVWQEAANRALEAP